MKNHHCDTRVIVAPSSHVPLYSLVESTQRVYGVRLFFVSARTNKRHHHQHQVNLRGAKKHHDTLRDMMGVLLFILGIWVE
jgi:hypothetical protein